MMRRKQQVENQEATGFWGTLFGRARKFFGL